jgi:hypothetical protein
MKTTFMSLAAPLSFPNCVLSSLFWFWCRLAPCVISQYADRKAKAISDIRERTARRKGEAPALRVRNTIAVDIDEVLGLFVPALCDFHNETYGTTLSPADFTSYRFCDVWGGTDQEVGAFLSCRVVDCLVCALPCRCRALSRLVLVLVLELSCFVFSCHALSFLSCFVVSGHGIPLSPSIDVSSFVENVPDHLFCAERFEGVRFLSNRSFPQFEGSIDVAYVAFACWPCFVARVCILKGGSWGCCGYADTTCRF